MGMEIITGVERRRRWRCEEKLRIVAEVERPGASFADVARRHEVSRGLLWNWRRQVRAGLLAPEPMPVFVPVQIAVDTPSPDRLALSPPCPARSKAALAEVDRIEIALPDGTCIRVGADVGLVALRRVMTAVRR
jgi:transposase-like protein